MIKLNRIKIEAEEEGFFEGRSIDNYEMQTLNFVKNTLPLFINSVSKLKSRKFNSEDKKPIHKLNSEGIIKTKGSEETSGQKILTKESGNNTNIKFQKQKAFYEYTSLELDKLREETRRREIKKVELPPIMKNNNWKIKSPNKGSNNSILKNKIINFEIVHLNK
jgi:hypothetical protein